jgi:hypothetical protein
MTGRLLKLLGATATIAIVASAAQADTWRYAFEEALNEVQGIYAQKFKANRLRRGSGT